MGQYAKNIKEKEDIMEFVRLNESNVEDYIEYLEYAFSLEPDMMCAESVDNDGIRARVKDSFYNNTTSVLARESGRVIGRIEYHFYGCMQDGCKMAYVDWIYVLPEFRHRGVARQLFKEFESDCKKNGIEQYYLIRAENPDADKFYRSFEKAELSREPVLRKQMK